MSVLDSVSMPDKGQTQLMVLETKQQLHLRVSHPQLNDIQWLAVSLGCKVQYVCKLNPSANDICDTFSHK